MWLSSSYLPDFMQEDPTARKRFLREAKSTTALDIPNWDGRVSRDKIAGPAERLAFGSGEPELSEIPSAIR